MKRTAFTLIELIVSIGIIVMMLTLSLPAFTTFQNEQQLNIAAQQVRDIVLTTNNYALAPREEKPDMSDHYGLFLDLTAVPVSYSIRESNPTTTPTTWTTVQSGKFASGIQLSLATDDPTQTPASGIVYAISKLGKIVVLSPTSPEELAHATYTITVTQSKSGKKKHIILETTTGKVEITDAI